MEPCPHHFQFFLHQLGHLKIPSWLRLWLDWVDASYFGQHSACPQPFTCAAGAEGEVPFLSPGFAKLQPPRTSSGPPLKPLLGWSLRGKGHGIWLRCGAANGLAWPGWMKPKKDTGHSPKGHTIPHLPSPSSSAHPILWWMAFSSFSC